MGWGVSYPSPHEKHERCYIGCDKHYECQAKACKHDNLCEGHQYTCADCGDTFCFDHVYEVLGIAEDSDAIFSCLPCLGQRQIINSINSEGKAA